MKIQLKLLPFMLVATITQVMTPTLGNAQNTNQDGLSSSVTKPMRIKTFDSANDAGKALFEALQSNTHHQLHQLLGHDADPYIFGKNARIEDTVKSKFVAAYKENVRIELKSDTYAVLHIGNNDWPLPFPIIKVKNRWHFDTAAGVQEWRDRRLGENELSAIQIALTYVQAQHEFAHKELHRDALLEYAQHIVSTDGKHDGLYWPQQKGEPISPMGQAFARAHQLGKNQNHQDQQPFHGYVFKILTAQGKSAPGGAVDYMVNGKLIGGFALVASPSSYSETGIKTFIVNHDGIVYSKDLGPETSAITETMDSYDPDSTWIKEKV